MLEQKMQFCIECREETPYRIQRVLSKECIRDKEYVFEVSEAICEKCGGSVKMGMNGKQQFKTEQKTDQFVPIAQESFLLKVKQT